VPPPPLHIDLPSLPPVPVPPVPKSVSNATPSNGTTMTLLPWFEPAGIWLSLSTSATAHVMWVGWPFSRTTPGRSILYHWLQVLLPS